MENIRIIFKIFRRTEVDNNCLLHLKHGLIVVNKDSYKDEDNTKMIRPRLTTFISVLYSGTTYS